MRARRVVLHLFSGEDVKTWQQLEDSNTVVICLDRALNPKMELNDHVMLFLMKLATTGSLQAVLGGPPCRFALACGYANDGGPSSSAK